MTAWATPLATGFWCKLPTGCWAPSGGMMPCCVRRRREGRPVIRRRSACWRGWGATNLQSCWTTSEMPARASAWPNEFNTTSGRPSISMDRMCSPQRASALLLAGAVTVQRKTCWGMPIPQCPGLRSSERGDTKCAILRGPGALAAAGAWAGDARGIHLGGGSYRPDLVDWKLDFAAGVPTDPRLEPAVSMRAPVYGGRKHLRQAVCTEGPGQPDWRN